MLLIRVDHPPGGEQLAVRGFTVHAEGGSWSETKGCEALHQREQQILDHARTAVLAAGDPQMSAAEAGRGLWDLLLGHEVHDWWQRQVAEAPGQVVRTILDVRAPELRSVPWELLARADAGPPFRSDRQPWVRAQTPWQHLDPLTVPVGVLVVVGDRSSRDLDVDEELAAIHGALRGVPGRWSVELLEAPRTMTKLEEAWRDVQPDVLHVISHGTEVDGQPALVIEGSLGPWPLYPTDVDQLPDPAPRLVVLNACRTADASTGREASWTFTDAFIRRGSAAVVAMQGDILSEGAVEFSRTLYSALAAGKAVDVAAAQGRRAIDARLRVTHHDDRCWALPCLSVAADPNQVLPVRVERVDLERFDKPPYSVHMERLTRYVDQTTERRRFWRAVDPVPGKAPRNLLVVTGERGFGKSAMVLSALLTLRLRGRNVVYVDLAEVSAPLGKRISWLTVLRAIRDALWDNWLPDAPQEPRRRFDHRLHFLKRYRDPDPWTPGSALGDNGEEFPSEGEDYDAWISKIFSAFLSMIDEAAGQEPLLVVLDSLGEVEPPDVSGWLCPRLLQPVGEEPQWSNLRFVVIGTQDQLKPLTAEVRYLAGDPMEMGRFRPGDLRRLAREFSARVGISLETSDWDAIHGMVDALPPISAAQFDTIVLGFMRIKSVEAGR